MSVPASAVKSIKSRVTLGNDKAERVPGPFLTLLFGVEGIGKSTFGSECPAPKVIDLERRTKHLAIARVPEPEDGWTWPDVLEAIRLFETEPHDRKTLVVDTLDELEALLWKYICQRDKKDNIEAYGYAKGYQAALDEWRVFMAAIERLQSRRGMNVLLTAHCLVKTFKNPEGDDYDRYQPKINDKAAGYLKGKVYDVLFAIEETYAVKKDPNSKTERAKGVTTGAHVVYTTRTPGHDGKNSHNLPEQMKLSAAEYVAAVQAFYATSAEDLRKQVEAGIARMPEKMRADATAALGRADTELKLGQLLGWIRNNAA
jgi:hypothetical protein